MGHGHYGMDSGGGGWVTTACVWVGSYIALVLVALCLTVGLFYLAEVRLGTLLLVCAPGRRLLASPPCLPLHSWWRSTTSW